MRAMFGVVSLLVVLAIVGLLASRQLKGPRLNAVPTSAHSDAASAPVESARVQSQRIQEQVRNDVNKALEQGTSRELEQ